MVFLLQWLRVNLAGVVLEDMVDDFCLFGFNNRVWHGVGVFGGIVILKLLISSWCNIVLFCLSGC